MSEYFKEHLEKLEETASARQLQVWRRDETGRLLFDGSESGSKAGRGLLNFSSNDYLGLARHPEVVQAGLDALRIGGAGSTSSRLVTGHSREAAELEEELAAWVGMDRALLYGSGYMANLGVLSALAGRNDSIYIDKLAHASLVDGSLLSGARLRRFRHNDLNHLEELLKEDNSKAGRKIIVSESIFSMDGDMSPVSDLVSLAAGSGAILLIDEAHALGVFGNGLLNSALRGGSTGDFDNLVLTANLSKALGGFGGFVVTNSVLAEFLLNTSRSLIYSTGLPPASLAAAKKSLELIRDSASEIEKTVAPGVLNKATCLRESFQALGLDTKGSVSQIVPCVLGSNERALELAAALEGEGILAKAIRPPTVPVNTARLRFSVTAFHKESDIKLVSDILRNCL